MGERRPSRALWGSVGLAGCLALGVLATACRKDDKPAPAATTTPDAATSASRGAEVPLPKDFILEDYVVLIDRIELARVVGAEWWWLEPVRGLRPMYVTLAGDVLLVDKADAVYLLDTSYSLVERIAASDGDFKQRMRDARFARALLRMDLVDTLRGRGINAGHEECFALGPPPSVGGEVRAEHAHAVDFRVELAFLSRLTQAMKGLAVGQEFKLSFVGWPGDPDSQSRARAALVVHTRDRPSFAVR